MQQGNRLLNKLVHTFVRPALHILFNQCLKLRLQFDLHAHSLPQLLLRRDRTFIPEPAEGPFSVPSEPLPGAPSLVSKGWVLGFFQRYIPPSIPNAQAPSPPLLSALSALCVLSVMLSLPPMYLPSTP